MIAATVRELTVYVTLNELAASWQVSEHPTARNRTRTPGFPPSMPVSARCAGLWRRFWSGRGSAAWSGHGA
jgi:hypothetical protein